MPVGAPFILLDQIPGERRALVQTTEGEWIEGRVDEVPKGWACWYPDKEDFE